ncbi:HAD-IB family hydrolase [Aquipuribacter nitratireducens]|uniref:HAD family hydrolase n=1 Tax=Aquipuribacter nitratireducens TaxID=650104 RepID=A0ABW0GQU7_9MICO
MPDASPDTARVAAFFDLDKTLLAASSTFALSRGLRRRGLLPPHTAARSAVAHASYMVRGADHVQMERMRDLLTELVAGWDRAVVEEVVAEALDDVVLPLVYPEAAELVRWHQEYGRDVVVVSSGAQEVVGPIGDAIGATLTVGSTLEVVDGRYTGRIEHYTYGPAKAEVLRRLAAERGYDLAACYAYSDSATDLPMLEAVGRPHAVNPGRRLTEHAETAGWPVLTLTPPAAAVRRLDALAAPSPAAVGTVGAVGVGVAATAGLGWYLARRRRRG